MKIFEKASRTTVLMDSLPEFADRVSQADTRKIAKAAKPAAPESMRTTAMRQKL
jgi:hypothetical protein